jgi:hypothetical protein
MKSKHLDFISHFVPPSDEKEPTPDEIAANEKRELRLAKQREKGRRRRERKKMREQSENCAPKTPAVA